MQVLFIALFKQLQFSLNKNNVIISKVTVSIYFILFSIVFLCLFKVMYKIYCQYYTKSCFSPMFMMLFRIITRGTMADIRVISKT